MKKIKLDGKLQLNKEVVSVLNKQEMNSIQGGRLTGSIGLRCTQRDGGCSAILTDLSKGWACNKSRATMCADGDCETGLHPA